MLGADAGEMEMDLKSPRVAGSRVFPPAKLPGRPFYFAQAKHVMRKPWI